MSYKYYDNALCWRGKYAGATRTLRLISLINHQDITHCNGSPKFNKFAKKMLEQYKRSVKCL